MFFKKKVANLPNSVLFQKEGLTDGELATIYSISNISPKVNVFAKKINEREVILTSTADLGTTGAQTKNDLFA